MAIRAQYYHDFREHLKALEERGKTPQEATLEEMDDLWNEAKSAE